MTRRRRFWRLRWRRYAMWELSPEMERMRVKLAWLDREKVEPIPGPPCEVCDGTGSAAPQIENLRIACYACQGTGRREVGASR